MGRPDPHVDRAVVAPGEPWLRAVCGHVAHVRAAAAGDLPLRHRVARVGVEHADAALVAVGDVELGGVAGEVEAVGAHPGRDLPLDLPGGAVEHRAAPTVRGTPRPDETCASSRPGTSCTRSTATWKAKGGCAHARVRPNRRVRPSCPKLPVSGGQTRRPRPRTKCRMATTTAITISAWMTVPRWSTKNPSSHRTSSTAAMVS